MSSSGSCLCGKVKYTFTGPPSVVGLCHCLTCQKLTGTAFTTNVIVPSSVFNITTGTDSLKSYNLFHPAGLQLQKNFCSNCGSTVSKIANGGFTGMVLVQGGTIDGVDGTTVGVQGKGPSGVAGCLLGLTKPGVELWTKSRAPWVRKQEDAMQNEEFAPGMVPV